jgi:hypothetical protein
MAHLAGAGPGGMWDYEAAVERCVRVWECMRETREEGMRGGGVTPPSGEGGGRVCADAHTHTRSTATKATGGA